MNRIKVRDLRIVRVRDELAVLVPGLELLPAGAGTARGEGTRSGWIRGLANTRLVEPGGPNRLIEFPALGSLIGELMRSRHADGIHQVMVNRLDPGGTLDVHRDGIEREPAPERWHLPVVTNPDVVYWQEDFPPGDPVHMGIGWWWGPISYWQLHSMVNGGDDPRVHVIVDLLVG